MADILPGGVPANHAEVKVIELVRRRGPDRWKGAHNVMIALPGIEEREIDLILVTDSSVVLIDTKGGRGRVTPAGPLWRQGLSVYENPAQKIRANARAFKTWLQDQDPRLHRINVDSLVVLAGENARLADPEGQDHRVTIPLADLMTTLQDARRLPRRHAPIDRNYRAWIFEALTKLIGPASGFKQFRDWKTTKKLSETDRLTEFLAFDVANPESGTALLQVHSPPPELSEAQYREHILRIRNGYDELHKIEPHPRIIRFRACFPNPGEAEVVTVMDHHTPYNPGDARPELIADLLEGLAHLHGNGALHRALSPAALVINMDGRGVLTRFDHARTGPPRGARSIDGEALLEAPGDDYLAPECVGRPDRLSPRSDVHAAGVLAFELATGARPADFDEPWGRLADEIGPRRADMVRSMCAPEPAERPTAEQAFQVFSADPEPDYADLPAGFEIDKYEVVARLGEPGAHAVAYHVRDTLDGGDRVLKLLHRDLVHARERVRTEHAILKHISHPAVTRPVHTNLYDGAIPYLVFEYEQGISLAELSVIELEEVRRFGEQLAKGLEALHQKGIHHRDITPQNLLWTGESCTIIDFNLAVQAGEPAAPGIGTPRYLPPDQPVGRELTAAELTDQDVYGLALCLYEAATGDYPWDAETPPPGVAPRRLNTDHDLADILDKALAPDRGDRFQSAADLYEALHYGLRARVRNCRPRLLVIDDHHTSTIKGELEPDYDCHTLKSKQAWDEFLANGGPLEFDGAIVDLHLSPRSLGEGIEIIEYLCRHTDIPIAVITMNTGQRDDEFNAGLRHRHRVVRLEHKHGEDWLDSIQEIARILTAETGTEASRRVLAVLDSAMYWMKLRTGDVAPDDPLLKRRQDFYTEYDEIDMLARQVRTVAEFRDLDRRALRLWREWFQETAAG
ncbi:hypothetical protein GCM10023085_62160 [Actinomadura viridis]|uniref:non-specific serine/threonine protein kinase n=1 Tax=Actinomadura viridis TaxID=58110 RepID=A0A931DEM1_9ACTN|nr:protein kinase [Actinomadura viridis]MBG6086066.1 serine/threonine protein kinase [Actinomadura viridis]